MANYAEIALLSLLTDVQAVEDLAKTALDPACVPTPGIAEIFAWAIDAFMTSGRTQAPSRSALEATWGTRLDELGIELVEEDVQVDTVATAVAHLKSQFAYSQTQAILVDAASAMAGADAPARPGVVSAVADRMMALAEAVRERPSAVDSATGVAQSLSRLQYRIQNPDAQDTFGLGLFAVDKHTGGIQAGEIASIVALQKTGKSFISLWAALSYWRQGGAPALFTLENTAAATFDRLVCMACSVDYRKFQRGEVGLEDLQRMNDWHSDHAKDLAERMTVMSPDTDGRSSAAMCRAARLRGADAIIIDQLSHMGHTSSRRFDSDTSMLATRLYELRAAVSVDTDPLKCLLLCQAKRESEKTVAKTGSLGVHSGGGTSEIERGSDHMYGLHRSEDDIKAEAASLELLAFRRGPVEKWDLLWAPWRGVIRAQPSGRLGAR